jgi:hypothetical protein
MKTELLRHLRAYFTHDLAPTHTTRYNMRAYVRARRLLGSKWLYSEPMRRPV